MTISTLNKNWLKRDELSETLLSFLFHFILFDNKPLFVPFLPFISSQLQKKSSRDRDRSRSRRSESVDTRANTTMSLSTSTSEWLKGAAAAEQEKEEEEEEEEGKKAKHRWLHEKKMIWYESARKGWNHSSIRSNEWPEVSCLFDQLVACLKCKRGGKLIVNKKERSAEGKELRKTLRWLLFRKPILLRRLLPPSLPIHRPCCFENHWEVARARAHACDDDEQTLA